MTIEQTQEIQGKIDRKKRRYEVKYWREFGRVYADQGGQMVQVFNASGNVQNLINKLPEIITIQSFTKPFISLYIDVGGEFAEQWFFNLKSQVNKYAVKEVQTGLDYSIGLASEWERLMSEYALNQGAASIVSIHKTSLAQAEAIIRAATSTAIEQGLSIDQTAGFIETFIRDEWRRFGKFSAERIARTEVLSAANYGSYQGALSTGLNLKKTWLTALDGRERETHAAANNQTVPMTAAFDVGGVKMLTPGAKGAPAAEVINCRCAVAYQAMV